MFSLGRNIGGVLICSTSDFIEAVRAKRSDRSEKFVRTALVTCHAYISAPIGRGYFPDSEREHRMSSDKSFSIRLGKIPAKLYDCSDRGLERCL